MNLRKFLMLLCCGCILSIPGQAQEKYSKVKIPAASRQFAIDRLYLDHYQTEKNNIIAILSGEEMQILRQSGRSFEILVDDVVAQTILDNQHTAPENNFAPIQGSAGQKIADLIPTPVSFGTGGSLRLGASAGNPGYFTYAEMSAKMLELATNNPGLVTRFSIGNSYDGQPIYAVKISDNVGTDENEPEVLYTALQHAREAIGGTSMIFFMQYLVENYGSNAQIQALVNNREIYIVPCVNPDGYAYNYNSSTPNGGGLWRKNRKHTGNGPATYGVDLNRNYGVDWGNCAGATTSCGSTSKSSDTYFGASAFSEPETQAIRDLVYARNFVNAIDQHCTGPYYSLPYGRPTLHPVMNTADSAFYTHIPALMGTYNGHRAGNSPETVNYEVAGGIKDWLLMGDIGTGTKGKIYGMTGEAGGGSFWAPISQINQLCKELCFQNLQLAYASGDYYDLQDKKEIGISSSTGKLSFQIRKIGLGNNNVTVSLIPLQNISSVGAPVTTTVSNYYGTYIDSIDYTLPASLANGSRIRFVWAVLSGGVTTYDTITKFYNPLTILYDDMEGNFSANWDATTTGGSAWSFSNAMAYEGSKSLTESGSGFYSTSSTRTTTYKNSFNLIDATSAYLSFWVKHRSENFRDKLQVQVSTDGSAWTAIANKYTIAEANTTNGGTLGGQPALTGIRDFWTNMTFDLDAYKGYPEVYLRFHFTSDGDGSSFAFERDEGFNIDNLKIIKTTNAVVLPVKFVNFYGRLLSNKTVQLDWEAYVDDEHSYFEVERASDANSNFISMNKIAGLPPYKSADYSPEKGNNYYRIKQVDKNGTVSYSNTIKINVLDQLISSIFPNPVKKQLSVRIINNSARENCSLQITDAAGRIIYTQRTMLEPGGNEVRIDFERQAPQMYFLKIVNSSNQVVLSEQFLKQ
jgi:hypothetical protein